MATKERFQNPVVGDQLKLRLFAYNSNARQDFNSIEKVEIYYLDPTAKTEENKDGRTLVQIITTDQVQNVETGLYIVSIDIEDTKYVIGQYIDVWYVKVEEQDEPSTVINVFDVYPDMWFTTPLPIVYDFNFSFRPNKIRSGSKRYLIIDIAPNVPTGSDLQKYYEALAIVSPLKISIEQACGDCLPDENDLRLKADKVSVELREKNTGYYLLDTTDFEPGIYNVWFDMEFGDTVHISDKQQLQIF